MAIIPHPACPCHGSRAIMDSMKSYRADAARRKMRDVLTAAEHGEHVQIQRYDTPTAIVVSPQWFKRALECLGEPMPVFEEVGP